jgi:hypothetical protein
MIAAAIALREEARSPAVRAKAEPLLAPELVTVHSHDGNTAAGLEKRPGPV